MTSRLRELFSPLSLPSVRVLLGAQVVSGVGDWAGRLALAILVYDRSSSPAWTAAVTVVSLLPWLGPGQWLSTFADRLGRVSVMVVTDVIRAAMFALMLIPQPLPLLLVLAFVAGTCSAPFSAARSSALVDVTSQQQYGPAVKLMSMAADAEVVLGYAVGGALVAALGARWALALNAASFLVSAVLVLKLRGTRADARHEEAEVGFAGLRAGFAVWMSDRVARRSLLLFMTVSAFALVPEALIVPLAIERDVPDSAIGLLAAMLPASAVVAAAFSPTELTADRMLRHAALWAAIPCAAAAALLAVGGHWTVLFAVFAVLGVTIVTQISTNLVFAPRLPRETRASATSVAAGASFGGQAAAVALAGGAAALWTPTSAAAGAVGLCAALSLVSWATTPPDDGFVPDPDDDGF